MGATTLKPWRVLASEPVFQAPPWIEVSRQKLLLPDGRTIDDYHRIALADFAVVVAQTPEGRVVLERMYKHAIGRVGLILPAGGIDAGEPPLAAAKRELLEETGYRADQWRLLGRFICNANYGCGAAHVFLARGARRVAEPDAGDLEEIEIVLLKPLEAVAAVRDGEIGSLGAAAAIALALNPAFAGRT